MGCEVVHRFALTPGHHQMAAHIYINKYVTYLYIYRTAVVHNLAKETGAIL